MQPEGTQSPSWVFQTFGPCTSVMFLALVSLERVYAVHWPLRHRVTNTSASLRFRHRIIVWGVGLCITGLLLTVYHAKVGILYAIVSSDMFLFISLVII